MAVLGTTTIFFSPSLYFSVISSPSTPLTISATVALSMLLFAISSDGRGRSPCAAHPHRGRLLLGKGRGCAEQQGKARRAENAPCHLVHCDPPNSHRPMKCRPANDNPPESCMFQPPRG